MIFVPKTDDGGYLLDDSELDPYKIPKECESDVDAQKENVRRQGKK